MNKSTEELLRILKKNKYVWDYISNNEDEFLDMSLSEYFEYLINKKNLKKSEIIKKSNLNVQYAYQIFKGDKKNPSRNKILQLTFAIGLDYVETNRVLKIAGYNELYPRNKRDSIIIYAINNNMSLLECDDLLFELGEEVLE